MHDQNDEKSGRFCDHQPTTEHVKIQEALKLIRGLVTSDPELSELRTKELKEAWSRSNS